MTFKEIVLEELEISGKPITTTQSIWSEIERASTRFANQQTQELQAKILHYRQYLYTRELQAYDKHFGITNQRYGAIEEDGTNV